MQLPTSNLSIDSIQAAFYYVSQFQMDFWNNLEMRYLFNSNVQITSSGFSFSSIRGRSYSNLVFPYTTPGSYTFLVPVHLWTSVWCKGGGGGGGGAGNYFYPFYFYYGGSGGNGGSSICYAEYQASSSGNYPTAYGGGGGGGAAPNTGSPGADGSGINYDTLRVGGGGAGGAGGQGAGYYSGGKGGNGGDVDKTWGHGDPGGSLAWAAPPGNAVINGGTIDINGQNKINITVGGGGGGGSATFAGLVGSPGSAGHVIFYVNVE